MTKTTTGTTVNVAALALKEGQFRNKIVRSKKGKGSYNRKAKW